MIWWLVNFSSPSASVHAHNFSSNNTNTNTKYKYKYTYTYTHTKITHFFCFFFCFRCVTRSYTFRHNGLCSFQSDCWHCGLQYLAILQPLHFLIAGIPHLAQHVETGEARITVRLNFVRSSPDSTVSGNKLLSSLATLPPGRIRRRGQRIQSNLIHAPSAL